MTGMILVECKRYFRKNTFVSFLAAIILASGLCGAALTLIVMLSLASGAPGTRSISYATISEEGTGGSAIPISWKVFEKIQDHLHEPDLELATYGEPVRIPVFVGTKTETLGIASTSNGFFSHFTDGLSVGKDFSSVGGKSTELIASAALADQFWGSATNAVGRSLIIKGRLFSVIGVAPRRFTGLLSKADAWVTPDNQYDLEFSSANAGNNHAAQSESSTPSSMWKQLPSNYVLAGTRHLIGGGIVVRLRNLVRSMEDTNTVLHVSPGMTEDPAGDERIRNWAKLSLAISIIILLAASFNFSALLLALIPKQIEVVRLKYILGASKMRILLDSACGPIVIVLGSALFAMVATVLIVMFLQERMKSILHLTLISAHTWGMVAGVEAIFAITLAIGIAVLPALRLIKDSGAPQSGATTTRSKRTATLMRGIICAQIMACILTCLLAVMIGRVVHALSREQIGFAPRDLRSLEIGPTAPGGTISFSTDGKQEFPMAALTRLVLQEVHDTFLGEKSESIASCEPLGSSMRSISIQTMDENAPLIRQVHYCTITQNYFDTMQNPIIKGRRFADNQLVGPIGEVIINQKLADELWPTGNQLHHTLRIERQSWGLRMDADVVGISQNMHLSGIENTPEAMIYIPLKSDSFTLSFPLYLLTRGNTPMHRLSDTVSNRANATMAGMGVTQSYSVQDRFMSSLLEQYMRVWLASVGAFLVAAIAYIGLYGVLTNSVNTRRKEMALRICFGASAWDLRRSVIREAAVCALIGTAAAVLGGRLLEQLSAGDLRGNAEWSWAIVAYVSVACVLVSIVVALLPANTAARVDPMGVLKEQ